MINQEIYDFYQKYKNCKWKLEKAPSGSDMDVASWLLNESNFGWLELDLDIDVSAWQNEASIATPYLVSHRESNNKGWNSCCIHGIDIAKTGAWTNYGYTNEEDVPYKWTDLADQTPVITNFWKNEFPSDHYRRVRFMEVQPGAGITPHSDMPGKLPGEQNFDALNFGVPINIAVIHPSQCYMTLEGFGVVPFKPGKAFIINIRHFHSVVNLSSTPRIHVIGHSYGYGTKKQEFASLVTRSYYKQYERN